MIFLCMYTTFLSMGAIFQFFTAILFVLGAAHAAALAVLLCAPPHRCLYVHDDDDVP